MIDLQRDFDAIRINRVMNDPSVRQDISEAFEGEIDLSAAVANTANVLLMGEHGGTFLIKLGGGIYEVHTQCLPPGRGAWIAEFVRAGTSWMFTHTDAFEIVTRVPKGHVAAKRLTQTSGMRYEFTRPKECKWRGDIQDVDIYSFRLQDWASQASSFEKPGRDFHDFLHAEAERLGVTDPAHPDDPNHNQYVGISLAMVEAGQHRKAVSFYNRWALASRHPVITLLKEAPITVRFDIGNLIFERGEYRVEKMDIAA